MELKNLQNIFDDIHNTIDRALDVNRLLGLKIQVRPGYLGASHNSPIGEFTNFARPKTYEAMIGRIWMRFNTEADGFWAVNIFNGSPYHIGTGGGGDYNSPWSNVYKIYYERFKDQPLHITRRGNKLYKPVIYSFAFNLWLDDFPELRKSEQNKKLLRQIAGDKTKPTDSEIHWTDIETAVIDDEFQWDPASGIAMRTMYNQPTRGI